MSLTILSQTTSFLGEQRRQSGLNGVRAGDRLEARIIRIESSGRTVLQFNGFRAVSENPIGGRVGDTVLFEVASAKENDARLVQPQLTVDPRNPVKGSASQHHGRIRTMAKRVDAFTGSQLPQSHSGKPLSPDVSSAAPFSTSVPANVIPGSLSMISMGILSEWLQRLLKNGAPLLRSDKPAHSRGHSALKTMKNPAMTEMVRGEHPAEQPQSVAIAGLHINDRPVKLSIYPDKSGNQEYKRLPVLTAVFLVKLDKTGAVRTDIRMEAERIKVDFYVENELCRRYVAEALPDLERGLSDPVRTCSLSVTVAPRKILAFELEEQGTAPSERVSIQV